MKPKPHFLFCCLALLICCFTRVPDACAHQSQHRTIEELTASAKSVIAGTVLSVNSVWEDGNSVIYTYVDIQVENNWKGVEFPPVYRMRFMGGQVGEIALDFDDTPHFTQGEDVILFLGPNPQSKFPIVNVTEGLFHAESDPATGILNAVSQHGLALPLSEVERRVRATVK